MSPMVYIHKVVIFIKSIYIYIFVQNKEQYLVKIENTTQSLVLYIFIYPICYVNVHKTTIEQGKEKLIEYNK
jgi:hypothetical protein